MAQIQTAATTATTTATTTSGAMHPQFATDLAAFQAKFTPEVIKSFPDAVIALMGMVFNNDLPLRLFWRDPNKPGPALSVGELRKKLNEDAAFAATFDISKFFLVAKIEMGIPMNQGSIPLRLELFFGRDVQEQINALLLADCAVEAVVVPASAAKIKPFRFLGADGVTPAHQRALLQFPDGDLSWPGGDDQKPRIGCAVRPTALVLAVQVTEFSPVDISGNKAFVLPPAPGEQGHTLCVGPDENDVVPLGFHNWDPQSGQITTELDLLADTGAIVRQTYESATALPLSEILRLRAEYPVKRSFKATPLTYSVADEMARAKAAAEAKAGVK